MQFFQPSPFILSYLFLYSFSIHRLAMYIIDIHMLLYNMFICFCHMLFMYISCMFWLYIYTSKYLLMCIYMYIVCKNLFKKIKILRLCLVTVFIFYFQKLVFGNIKKKQFSYIFEIKNMFG